MGLSFIPPLLPTLVEEAPEGEDWQHEIKYDGYRTQLVIHAGSVRAFTRNGHNWTTRYQHVIHAARELSTENAIIDGEMIVQDEQGRSDYHAFKSAITQRPRDLVFMAFDLLHDGHRDVRKLPLIDRRNRLHELVGEHNLGYPIQFSDHVDGDGSSLFEAAERMGLEGIVSKKRNSRYVSGRSLSWLKVKCFTEGEFVVVGTERGLGPTTALLASETAGELTYVGGAMLTLPDKDRERFWSTMEQLAQDKPPVTTRKRKDAQWVQPALSVRVRYLKGGDKLRHATVLKLL